MGSVASGRLVDGGVTRSLVVDTVVVLPWSRSETFGVADVEGRGRAGAFKVTGLAVDRGADGDGGVLLACPRDNVMPSARPQQSTPIITSDMCNGR